MFKTGKKLASGIRPRARSGADRVPLFLLLIGILSYGRVAFINDIFWDDNCWFLARHVNDTLAGFLDDGFNEMRRVPLGMFFYAYFGLSKLTAYAMIMWQVFGLLIQVITPIVLYRLATNLAAGNRWFGAAVATTLVVMPLDHALPFLSIINYRLGLLLELVSLLLTERAVNGGATRWAMVLGAITSSCITQYVFIEGAIALEPMRFLMIWYCLARRTDFSRSLPRAVGLSALFVVPALPLVAYKLTYPPYGMYQSIYKTDMRGVTDWRIYYDLGGMLFFGLWRRLAPNFWSIPSWSHLLGLIAAAITFFARRTWPFSSEKAMAWVTCRDGVFLGVFAAGIILLQQVMYAFAGREVKWGPDSSHATFMQIGLALIGGLAVAGLVHRANTYRIGAGWVRGVLATLVGVGVAVNNVNLDGFIDGAEKQQQFWRQFLARYPALPPSAHFIFDIDVPSYHDSADLDTSYDLEAYLNLIYATSTDPGDIHRYSVLGLEDIRHEKFGFDSTTAVTYWSKSYMTRFASDTFNPADTIIVVYRNGQLLVNDEILKAYPDAPYAPWIQGPAPVYPASGLTYPYRNRCLHE